MSGPSILAPDFRLGPPGPHRRTASWSVLGMPVVAFVLGIALATGIALFTGSMPAAAQPVGPIPDDRSLLDGATLEDATLEGIARNGITLDGIVVDKETGTPLHDAHVFLAGSMRGTTTDADGRFELRDVRQGAQRLYASMMGYEPQFFDLFLQTDTTYTFAFRLPPQVIERPGVVVEAERDPDWHKRLARFETLFLGSSEWADSCTIQNPEALRFESKWWGKFTARAVEPLVVINRALGYRVQYFLDEFEASGGVIRWMASRSLLPSTRPLPTRPIGGEPTGSRPTTAPCATSSALFYRTASVRKTFRCTVCPGPACFGRLDRPTASSPPGTPSCRSTKIRSITSTSADAWR